MTNLSLHAFPNIQLEQTEKVTQFDDALQSTISKMFETMQEAELWCLAAPHVDIDLSVFTLLPSDFIEEKACFINPTITHQEGEMSFTSNCLYFPDVEMVLKRPEKLTVAYFDEKGSPKELKAEGGLAAIIAYLVDCLEGVLVIDRMKKLKKESFLKRYAKAMASHNHCDDENCHIEH